MNNRQKELIHYESVTRTYKPNLMVISDGLSKYDLRDKAIFKEKAL
jgi:hypothetical protein